MQKKQTGFTLIEVIVALALFAVSVLILTQSFLNGLICKTTIAKEDDRPFLYQMIRSDLNRLKRDQVPNKHKIVFLDNKTNVEWQGQVVFADIMNLYQVNVRIGNDTEDTIFYIRRPDWMNETEKAWVKRIKQENKQELKDA